MGDDFLGIMIIVSSPPLTPRNTRASRPNHTARRVDATLGHAEFSSPMFARDSVKRIDRPIESNGGRLAEQDNSFWD